MDRFKAKYRLKETQRRQVEKREKERMEKKIEVLESKCEATMEALDNFMTMPPPAYDSQPQDSGYSDRDVPRGGQFRSNSRVPYGSGYAAGGTSSDGGSRSPPSTSGTARREMQKTNYERERSRRRRC